jgi:cell division protein ZapA
MATATKHPAADISSVNPPAKDSSSGSVRAEIFDQGYNLRGSDPEYILKLAEYVDSKMRAVAQHTHTVDTARVAVLAALNIADEYHLLQGRGEPSPNLKQRAKHLSHALDEVLDVGMRAG